MGNDDDIAVSLPETPPPSPARREAAIDEASRRFDAIGSGPRVPQRSPAGRASWWIGISRPQAAALATVGLVALIGVPVAWMSVSQQSAIVRHETLASAADRPVMLDIAPATPPAVRLPAEAAVAPAAPAEPKRGSSAAMPVAASPTELAGADAEKSLPTDWAAARTDENSPSRSQLAAAAVVPSPMIAMAAPPPPAAPSAPPRAEAAAGDDIVVTSRRRTAQKSIGRGDWNACTVDDPRRTLAGCKRLVDPAAVGAAGRAAAHIADGLSRAWQGDFDGAIAAFDRAIELAPRLSFAYLNRGLAYRHRGELDRAIADLDQAVRFAPGAARGYYNRSRLLRERGDADRASADEDRAVDLDPRYGAVAQ